MLPVITGKMTTYYITNHSHRAKLLCVLLSPQIYFKLNYTCLGARKKDVVMKVNINHYYMKRQK